MGKQTQKVLAFVAAVLMLSSAARGAECDTSTLKRNPDGTVLYTKECHTRVGQIADELDLRKEQIKRLEESREYYRQGYDLQAQRAEDWQNTAVDLDKELQRKSTFSDIKTAAIVVLTVLVIGAASNLNK
jgi:Spy/CpxP family protein refolding chaperone